VERKVKDGVAKSGKTLGQDEGGKCGAMGFERGEKNLLRCWTTQPGGGGEWGQTFARESSN